MFAKRNVRVCAKIEGSPDDVQLYSRFLAKYKGPISFASNGLRFSTPCTTYHSSNQRKTLSGAYLDGKLTQAVQSTLRESQFPPEEHEDDANAISLSTIKNLWIHVAYSQGELAYYICLPADAYVSDKDYNVITGQEFLMAVRIRVHDVLVFEL